MSDRKILFVIGIWAIGAVVLGSLAESAIFDLGGAGAVIIVGLAYFALLPFLASRSN